MKHLSAVTSEQWERLDALISSAFLRHKNGEVAVLYDPDHIMHWDILLSNECISVGLGEASGRYQGYGETFEDALTMLEKAFNDPQR
ncbi:MAG: hypothetical protein NXH70_02260 [Hyphomonas sp.]|nr:hypothetical protein [Hyphomonas sp.]